MNYFAPVAILVIALTCNSHGLHEQHDTITGSLKLRRLLAENNDIDEAILAAFENLRAEMSTGNAELEIPPLDPYYIGHYVLDMEIEKFRMNLTLDNTTVSKLSGFVVNSIHNDLENLKADFNVTVPQLYFEGQYIADGELEDFINITGNGSYTLELEGLTTWGTVTLGSEDNSGDAPVIIEALDIDFIIDSLKTDFQNLMGGGSLEDIANELISTNGAQYLNEVKPGVNEYISDLVLSIANPILGHYTINEILDFLGVDRD